jgi:hypothetical protein
MQVFVYEHRRIPLLGTSWIGYAAVCPAVHSARSFIPLSILRSMMKWGISMVSR